MAKILIPPDIKKRRALLKMLDKMLEKSELTDEDTIELGRKLRQAGARELVEKGMV